MSINAALSIAQTGLQANQYAITVTSNNIANVNTEGFCKQRVDFCEIGNYNRVPTAKGLQYTGAGVQVADLKSFRNEYLDDCYRKNNSVAQGDGLLADYAGYIESFFNAELDGNGLSGALNAFYDAAQKLSTNPSDMILRTNYMEAANSLAKTFNSVADATSSYVENIAGDYNNLGSSKNSQIGISVTQVNSLLSQIAELNGSIMQNKTDSSLANTRASLMDQLSAIVPFETTHNVNGTVNISIAGHEVIKGMKQIAELRCTEGTAEHPAIISLVDEDGKTLTDCDDISSSIKSGQLGAYLQLVNGTDSTKFSLQKVTNKLNIMAQEFANVINEEQTYNDGTTAAMAMDGDKLVPVGENDVMFTTKDLSDTITAANICVNKDLLEHPQKLAAARVEIDADGNPVDPDAIGDNKNILAVIATRDKGIPGLNNLSAGDYFKNLVSEIGSDVDTLNSNAEVSQTLTDAIESQRDADMGVNLDEELMNLIKFQRAYEASAKVLSSVNQAYETLLSMV